jgi:uncharacterized protein involved in exopolysaccharide biosynthesis
MKEFSAFEATCRVLQKWWLVVLFVVVGGIAGWLFHKVQPPVYEAKAVFGVSVDVTQRCLTQSETDRALNIVGALLNSSIVKETVVARAQSLGYPVTLAGFRQSTSLERRQSVLEIRVRGREPATATALANLWAEVAYERLIQAREHASQAYLLQQQLTGWLICLPGYVTPTPGSSPLILAVPSWSEKCENYTIEEIEEIQSRLSTEIAAEQQQSLGVLPFLNFVLAEKASVPDQPILYRQGIVVLAGAVIGLVVSVWIILSGAMQHHVWQ